MMRNELTNHKDTKALRTKRLFVSSCLRSSRPIRVHRRFLRLLLASGILFLFVAQATWAKPVFPGKTWQTKTPAEVGLDAAKLDAFRDFVGGRGCVMRHGCMVYTWGDYRKPGDVASASKPVKAHFLFKAVEMGKVAGLDEKVAKWEPRLNDLNANLGYKDRKITWRHMANQISCYGVTEAPGTAFNYNDYQLSLFVDTLFIKVYRAKWEDVDAKILHLLLTDALQCEDSPTLLAFGMSRPGRLGISPRDFARFGLLYLHKGNWNGKQLISSKYAVMAVTSPLPNSIPRSAMKPAEMIPSQRSIGALDIGGDTTDHYGSYTWLWWRNGITRDGKRHLPDAPTDMFAALGHGGMRGVVVMPKLDLIVSWNDTKVKGWEMVNQALGLLTASVKDAKPVPARERSLGLENGWFTHNGKVVWGNAQHNGWWGGLRKEGSWINTYKVRANITRNAPGKVGPSLTEDLGKLTDAMLKYGYPGFEHNFGLWFDRRRDAHDTVQRSDPNVVPPLLEQPWARSKEGIAWDGLPKYDLTQFNPWYFQRLREFAALCDKKGTILFHNFYM